jgi:SAM-dependent methyltransferase
MRPRIALAKLLVHAGELLRTLPVVVLRPSDMLESSRLTNEQVADRYQALNVVDRGLTSDELALLEKVAAPIGRVLILGGGGGREAVWFAQQGWQVAAVDLSPHMLQAARDAMAQRQLAFDGWVGDVALAELPGESYDLIWMSTFLYSWILNRKRRIAMLRRIRDALKPGGALVVSFYWHPGARSGPKAVLLRRALAWLTLGNIQYENGDTVLDALDISHAFSTEHELQAELAAGGFDGSDGRSIRVEGIGPGAAVLHKRNADG